jgi:hypothetical protein
VPVALELPGPSRRIVVEPVVLPEPVPEPAEPAAPEPPEPAEAPVEEPLPA